MPKLDSSEAVQQAVYTALSGDSGLMALVSGMYAVAPESAVPPFLTFRLERSENTDTKTRYAQTHQLLVVLRGAQPSFKALQQAMSAAVRVLDGSASTLSGFRWVRCQYRGSDTKVNVRTRFIDVNVRFQIVIEQL